MEITITGLKVSVLDMYSDYDDGLERAKEAFKWIMEDIEVARPEGATVTKLEPVQ